MLKAKRLWRSLHRLLSTVHVDAVRSPRAAGTLPFALYTLHFTLPPPTLPPVLSNRRRSTGRPTSHIPRPTAPKALPPAPSLSRRSCAKPDLTIQSSNSMLDVECSMLDVQIIYSALIILPTIHSSKALFTSLSLLLRSNTSLLTHHFLLLTAPALPHQPSTVHRLRCSAAPHAPQVLPPALSLSNVPPRHSSLRRSLYSLLLTSYHAAPLLPTAPQAPFPLDHPLKLD